MPPGGEKNFILFVNRKDLFYFLFYTPTALL